MDVIIWMDLWINLEYYFYIGTQQLRYRIFYHIVILLSINYRIKFHIKSHTINTHLVFF